MKKYEYLPYGGELAGGNNSVYTFTGQENDPEINLMYYKARYHSPYLRQFTQPDSIIQDVYDPQTLNRFAYTRNNPVKYVDEDGHFPGAFIGPGAFMLFIGLVAYAEWKGLNAIKDGLEKREGKNSILHGAFTVGYEGIKNFGGKVIGVFYKAHNLIPINPLIEELSGSATWAVGENIAKRELIKRYSTEVISESYTDLNKNTMDLISNDKEVVDALVDSNGYVDETVEDVINTKIVEIQNDEYDLDNQIKRRENDDDKNDE